MAESTELQSFDEMRATRMAGMMSRISAPSGDRIKLTGKVFTFPDGRETTEPIDVVIVDFVSNYVFYDKPYREGDINPPACFAIGPEPSLLVPSKNSPDVQAESCSVCPMNQFGSKGDGKACRNMRLLAVLPPDADVDTPLWLMTVSPTGLKSFDGYIANLFRKGMAPSDVITKVGFDPLLKYESLRFHYDSILNPDAARLAMGRVEEASKRLTMEPSITPPDASAGAVRGKPRGGVSARR